MKLGVLLLYRKQIMQVTSALEEQGKHNVRGVEEYAEQHPGEVNDIVVSLAPKYEHFRTGYYWFGVVQLCDIIGKRRRESWRCHAGNR